MSEFVKQIMSGQIDWALVTPERVQKLSQTFF